MKRFIFALIVFGFMGSVSYAGNMMDEILQDSRDRRQEQQIEEQRMDIERNRSMMDAMESEQRAREQTERNRQRWNEWNR